jgi:membrane protease subunit HflC
MNSIPDTETGAMTMAAKRNGVYWPVILLGVFVALVFLGLLFVFEVKETEFAVVKRLGKPLRTEQGVVRIYKAGLHFKWPFVDRVWRHDNRLQPYDLKRGQVEQVQTLDDYQVIVTTFVLWKVGDPHRFLKAFQTTADAETKLDEVIRNSRNSVLAQHRLTDLINVEPGEQKVVDIEAEILAGIKPVAMTEYGIDVAHLGIKHLGFPEQVTTNVFTRMTEERQSRVEEYRSAGREEAERIKTEADLAAKQIITEAEAEATRIRGEGDRQAAEELVVFGENPELAAFLRKLEALKRTLSDRTTLVLDTDTPPFDLFQSGAVEIEPKSETER